MLSVHPKLVNVDCEELGSKCICPYCTKVYASKRTLSNHINGGYCLTLKKMEQEEADRQKELENDERMKKMLKEDREKITKEFDDKLAKFKEEVEQIKVKSVPQKIVNQNYIHNHNQNDTKNLNVMCIGSQDNLLDILTSRDGLHLALTYIKESALGKQAGACKILQRVYMPKGARPAIMYRNKTKNQFVFYDENNKKQEESNPAVIAKKLADILQRSYLKFMDSVKIDLCGERRQSVLPKKLQKDIPEVDSSDLNLINEHIHELQNEKYQKSLLKSLNIPFRKDIPDESDDTHNE